MFKKNLTIIGLITSAIGVYHFASVNGMIPGSVQANIRNLPIAAADYANRSGNPELGTIINATAAVAHAYENTVYPNSNYSGYNPNNPNSGYQNSQYGTNPYGNPYGNGGMSGGGDLSVYFSPSGGCTDAVVREISLAQRQILVQAYSFTSTPIAQALVAAHQRGVTVYVLLDKSQKSEQYSSADFVAHAGIPTYIDDKHAIAHNKIILIDQTTIITGSFNFSNAAEKSNAENLLVIRNRPDLSSAYENNFRNHYEHCQPYQARGTGAVSTGFFRQ
jgi:phosphatidylserine/phosphatidylglycerophosphate/cardiolipin synthase-like enzyme